MKANSTARRAHGKPDKPYPTFPLFAHASGRWAKKVRGRFYYFGKWEDPEGAVQRWVEQRDDLLAGRLPKARSGGPTIRDVVNAYLTSKGRKVEAGELEDKSFRDYHAACAKLVSFFGAGRLVEDLHPEDWGRYRAYLARGRGPVGLWNEIRRARLVFSWALQNDVIPTPPKYGSEFDKPSARVLRQDQAKRPAKVFGAQEVCRMLDAANPKLSGAILLAINCGLGNDDIASIPIDAIDWQNGWHNFPRGKTGVPRRARLWPETLEALQAVRAERKPPKNLADAKLLFLSKHGQRMVRNTDKATSDGLGEVFKKLLTRLGMQAKGRGFYALRHSYRTAADTANDDRAVDVTMGHQKASYIGNVYRHDIEDARLERVAQIVHGWLFGPSADAAGRDGAQSQVVESSNG